MNRRKEFFRVALHDIKSALDEMGLEARWTMSSEARDYPETLVLENAMNENPVIRAKWLEERAAQEDAAALRGVVEVEEDDLAEVDEEVEMLS